MPSSTSPALSENRAEPFPSNPQRPTTIGLYMTNEKLDSWHYIGFAAKYAAAVFLEDVQKTQGKFKLNNDDMIFESGWTVSMRGVQPSATIKELLRYEPTKSEQDWTLPEEVINNYRILRTKSHDKKDIPKPIKQKADEKTKPKTLKPNGEYTSLNQLSKELGVSPNRARRLLRDKKVAKPANGWEWSATDLPPVLKLLRSLQ